MLSQTVEYALRAVVHLAQHAPEAQTTAQIASATRVPQAYLVKVLQGLGRAGIVRSSRGIGGGMVLDRAREELTLLEVVNAVEPIRRIKTCPLGISSHGSRLCPLHRRIDDSIAQVESAFHNTTLDQLLTEPGASTPLCDGNSPAEPLGHLASLVPAPLAGKRELR